MEKQYTRLMTGYMSELMSDLPAISIDGLKGIGKTSIAKDFANTAFELDNQHDHILISNRIDRITDSAPPVLIDEWQKIPETWDYIRRAVDQNNAPGRFLLTGSISSKNHNIHSGAGRIVHARMYPLSLQEREIDTPTVSLEKLLDRPAGELFEIEGETKVNMDDYLSEILLSGLPALRIGNEKNRNRMIRSYIENLLTHDFEQEGIRVRQPHTLMRWLTGYAASVATTAGYNEILDASTAGEGSKPNAKTTIAYREALSRLWLIDELPAWIEGENYYSRLKMGSKHYLADTAFAAHLLGMTESKLKGTNGDRIKESRFDTKYGNIVGRLFEALVFQSLRVYTAVNDAGLSYFQTQNGDREIDFIITTGSRTVAIEVKAAPFVTDHDVRHLLWLKKQMGDSLCDAIVLTTGTLAYRRPDGIAVVPAALLGA